MANKKIIEKRLEQERIARERRNIQIAGLAIAVVLVLAGIWYFTLNGRGGVAGVGSSPACEPFAGIPVAAQYDEPPMGIDVSSQYFATVKMANGGEFVMQLYANKTPITVNSFVFLACKGFFNGLTFHRVIEGFMAQGGDPTGTGGGDPGYSFQDEFRDDLVFDKEGILAMANSGPNTNGSQFFITYGPTPHLNGLHTIFGQVVEGMDIVSAITRRDPQSSPSFLGDAIESVTITAK